jgi:hypothetical protein
MSDDDSAGLHHQQQLEQQHYEEHMALSFSSKGGGMEFKPVSEGTHIAVWSGIVDIGPQPGKIGSYPKPPTHEVAIIWDIPGERVAVDGVEKPSRQYALVTASMDPRSKLRGFVEGTVGKMSDEAASVFDLYDLLGKGCFLSIRHKKSSNGKTYTNVATVAPLIKGMEAPPLEAPPIGYGGERQSPEDFALLPAWLQKKIQGQLPREVYERERKEFFARKKAAEEASKVGAPPPPEEGDPGFDDEIPF